MNMPTIIVGLIVAAAFVLVVVFEIKKRKKGKGCCGGCSGCAMAGSCERKKDESRKG